MLRSMQEVVADQFSQALPSQQCLHTRSEPRRILRGLLATLAAAKPTELPTWNDEELSPDVATLSYGSGHTHARSIATDDRDNGPAYAEAEPVRSNVMRHSVALKRDRDRKCSSVTLRMSKAEGEQLRARAAEAGLTVSAYLRLCAFEAEALRAEVKEALAELRRAPAPEAESARSVESSRGSRLGWLRRMMPDLHLERSLARA